MKIIIFVVCSVIIKQFVEVCKVNVSQFLQEKGAKFSEWIIFDRRRVFFIDNRHDFYCEGSHCGSPKNTLPGVLLS